MSSTSVNKQMQSSSNFSNVLKMDFFLASDKKYPTKIQVSTVLLYFVLGMSSTSFAIKVGRSFNQFGDRKIDNTKS